MTSRGRPHKAESPDTECAESKTTAEEKKKVCLPRSQRKHFTEERQPGTTKEQKPKEQKKTIHTEEKSSVQSNRKEKTIKQQTTPKDNRNATVQGTKAKICASKAQTTEQSAEEIPKMQPETPKDTTKDSLKTTKSPVEFAEETPKDITKDSVPITKPKTCASKIKSPEKFKEETTEMQPETPKDITKDSVPITKPKTCASKIKSPEKFKEETTEMQPETPKDITKDSAPITLLRTTLEKLKIKRNDKADAAEVINKIIEDIVKHLKGNSQCFNEVEQPLRTGSYYENLKISNPDEFDVMLPIPVDRVKVTPFGNDGAFYSVALKRGKNPLQKFQENDTLSGSKMLKEFREEVKKCVGKFREWEVTRKKKGCPAVTLTTKVQSVTISLDVVLSLVIKSSWPPFTKEGFKIDDWLGTKVKQEYKREPFYLVPKYEGWGAVENDGVFARDVWRVSFSHIEKAILRNHGSAKTCCEKGKARCCRKDCLKLLKHLLNLLKVKNTSFDKFCSYHAKTTLLHACCSRPIDSDWSDSSLSLCFLRLLNDFVAHLECGELYNFFIPTQNLLSGINPTKCKSLARCIKEEHEKGFPIFQVTTGQTAFDKN
ncbi:cyclic GMP-AMP synthase [Pempheris klunzingeri]|uniref:cyclic GMP-AMP synthase n=1 Tax=Pempheris klunzingeri TaxID=3127111 RepID=UPI003981200A